MLIKEWLQGLADSTQSTEEDSAKMCNLLRRVGFPSAVVVIGIVYLKGKGTLEFPPTSIQSVAKMLLKVEEETK